MPKKTPQITPSKTGVHHVTPSMKGHLYAELCKPQRLLNAWQKVDENQGSAGGDGVTLDMFEQRLNKNINQLSSCLLDGTYQPKLLREVHIPKKKGGKRKLLIPSIQDRIIHRAIADILSPIFEPLFEDHSYAYRPGRSVKQAVGAISNLRNQGFEHVIEADIVNFFDEVRHDILIEKLFAATETQEGGKEIVDLIASWLDIQAMQTGVQGKGIAQGSPLSPLLANLYLDALDEALTQKGVQIIRFADDFVILTRKQKSAEKAMLYTEEVLAAHGLKCHPEKTRILDFKKGFEFLGHKFVRSLVLEIEDNQDDVNADLRYLAGQDEAKKQEIEIDEKESQAGYDKGERLLYLTEPKRRLSLRNASFSIENEEERELAAISHNRVDRIEISPRVDFDPEIIRFALDTQTRVCFINGYGEEEGYLATSDDAHGALHIEQAAAVLDSHFCLEIARSLVDARIRNQRAQLFRLNRRQQNDEVTKTLTHMGRNLRKVPHATSVEALRGLEGRSGALYWPALASLTLGASLPFKRQRPAKDALNASLNYLSAILERDCRGAAQATQLHRGFGFLHSAKGRGEPLVYDMMESFRAPLSEGIASYLFNARRLKEDMFIENEKGVRISSSAIRAIITRYETVVASKINITGQTGKLAWRPMMRHQARSLVKAIKHKEPQLFQPYLMEA